MQSTPRTLHMSRLALLATLVSASALGTALPTPALSASASVGSMIQGGSPCSPEWIPTLGPCHDLNGEVYASVVFDDGGGDDLYIGGRGLSGIGGSLRHLVRWDGSAYTAVGDAFDNEVRALAVHDDGSGPALYAAGRFTQVGSLSVMGIARWDGSSWSAVLTSINGPIFALASYDDGNGPALYVGGSFRALDGLVLNNIARLNGSFWSGVGGGANSWVEVLQVFDDGSGPALYAAGPFNAVGGLPTQGFARWAASGWSPQIAPPLIGVGALHVYDDGSGLALYAGARIGSGAAGPSSVVRRNGSSWASLGSGVDGAITDLQGFDDGNGPALYALSHLAGMHPRIDRWDSSGWSQVVLDRTTRLATLVTFDDGGGSDLYVGGKFQGPASALTSNIARLENGTWEALSRRSAVAPLTVAVSYGRGPARRLIAVRDRTGVGGSPGLFVDAWDGTNWTSLGEVTGASATMLQVADTGFGEELYLGGDFTAIAGVPASGIARFDGTTWSAMGSGVAGHANDVIVFDGGAGPELFVAGSFQTAGGVTVNGIASWDGSSWSALAGGVVGVGGEALSLARYDSGSGPELIVCGHFAQAGGVGVSGIARWNGALWRGLGGPLVDNIFLPASLVRAAETFDDGSGPALYFVGQFASGGGVALPGVARWRGQQYEAVGTGPVLLRQAGAMAVFDDGRGPALFVGGVGTAPDALARWDGQSWSALGAGISAFSSTGAIVKALAVYDDGNGRALCALGDFDLSPAGDCHFARWRGCAGNIGEVYCAPAVTNSTGASAQLTALGSTSVVEDDVILVARDLPPGSFGLFLTSTTRGLVPGVGGTQGTLCLGGGIGRYVGPGQVQSADPGGTLELPLDLMAHPTPAGLISVLPGDTRHFQTWYRDTSPMGSTANLTSGLTIQFE